jgi:hypothetical protein
VLNCVVDHILQEFYALFLTRFRTYKIASPPKAKKTSKDDIYGWVFFKVPSSMFGPPGPPPPQSPTSITEGYLDSFGGAEYSAWCSPKIKRIASHFKGFKVHQVYRPKTHKKILDQLSLKVHKHEIILNFFFT